MLSFSVSKHDAEIIERIVDRLMRIAREHHIEYVRMDARMDLTAVHANGCPLRLAELLESDNFDFAHDVFGIRNNLNRETGALNNCFLPRFAGTARGHHA